MSTSNAIENLVERFVSDLVGFLHEEEGNSRAAALAIVMSMLARSGVPSSAPAPAPRKPTRGAAIWSRQRRQPSAETSAPSASATPESPESPKTPKTPKSQKPLRSFDAPMVSKENMEEAPEEATEEEQVSLPLPRPRIRHPRMIVVPAGQSPATYKPPTPSTQLDLIGLESSATPTEPVSQRRPVQGAAEREALMLESVRTLVRATAGEIAQHGGLPSGTAYVVLKQLISNGRVAKTETARGVEYSLVSTGAVRPFKRARGGSVEAAAEEQIPSATGEA
jgi:hypothetical protein